MPEGEQGLNVARVGRRSSAACPQEIGGADHQPLLLERPAGHRASRPGAIAIGSSDIVIAGGVESMTHGADDRQQAHRLARGDGARARGRTRRWASRRRTSRKQFSISRAGPGRVRARRARRRRRPRSRRACSRTRSSPVQRRPLRGQRADVTFEFTRRRAAAPGHDARGPRVAASPRSRRRARSRPATARRSPTARPRRS